MNRRVVWHSNGRRRHHHPQPSRLYRQSFGAWSPLGQAVLLENQDPVPVAFAAEAHEGGGAGGGVALSGGEGGGSALSSRQ